MSAPKTLASTLVYTAGPYRDISQYAIERNIRRAESVAVRIAETGAGFVCPHSMTRFFGGLEPDAYWLEATLETMRRCDAVVLVDGWMCSEGAMREADEAAAVGLPVFDSTDDGWDQLRRWLRAR